MLIMQPNPAAFDALTEEQRKEIIVDRATRERAPAPTAMIPDVGVAGLGIEVRPILFSAGPPA